MGAAVSEGRRGWRDRVAAPLLPRPRRPRGGKALRLTVAILLLLVGGQPLAEARTATTGQARPLPIGSPADWLSPDDYPIAALRNDMEGVTIFRLAVGADGRPTACDVTGSSGFDVLDQAACERLMKNARFTPARDAAGRATVGSYANRVRWTFPANAGDFSPATTTLRLQIDAAGKITGCKVITGAPAPGDDPPCRGMSAMPANIALIMRGDSAPGEGEVIIDYGAGYGDGPPPTLLAQSAGYERRAMFVSRFTVTAEGRLGTCRMTEQRGEAELVQDFCLAVARDRFDPPFALIGADGSAKGWNFGRILARRER